MANAAKFKKIYFSELADCAKSMQMSQRVRYSGLLKELHSVTFSRQSQLILLKPLIMVLCSSIDSVPLKFNIKTVGVQFIITDRSACYQHL
jgi:hypothetical protein